MQVCTLASGSSGNCIFIGTGKSNVLIDAGISCKRINDGLQKQVGITGADIDAILITHEHTDHIQGLEVFSRRFKTPIYATRGTWQRINQKAKCIDDDLYIPIQNNQNLQMDNLIFNVFATLHDAADPVGFVVSNEQKRLGIATDLGILTANVISQLQNCDALILEANYDHEMLLAGNYPCFLKKRIASAQGHLSNEEAARGLMEMVGEKTKTVILAHLSQENNLPSLAQKTTENIFRKNGFNASFNLKIAPRTEAGACLTI